MHPTLIEALAGEHRTELLRQAETYRRAGTGDRGRTGLGLASVVSRAERAAAWLRRSTAVAGQPRTQTCCA